LYAAVVMYFVREDSIVREIWGKPDTILFIFASAAAEFALNKAVDWLFFTGRLPADPLGRLFSTVTYSREIVFSTTEKSHQVIDSMARIHREVEDKRGTNIPDWAYRDVLYMLIDYSIRSYELLYSSMTSLQKEEVYDVFKRVGARMGLSGLPPDYENWVVSRERHLREDLHNSDLTTELFKRYRAHLGPIRYQVLLMAQSITVPRIVRDLLRLRKYVVSVWLVKIYKVLDRVGLGEFALKAILPAQYVSQVLALNSFRKPATTGK
jgi:uncharacterized protein (DUF2236 family)